MQPFAESTSAALSMIRYVLTDITTHVTQLLEEFRKLTLLASIDRRMSP
jgi:hypothetical protein